MKGTLYFDGGARPTNPGYAGFACVVVTERGTEEVLSRFIGRKTNNQAEFYGLIVGIKFAFFLAVRELDIYSDSQLVIETVKGNWRAKNQGVKRLSYEARDILSTYFSEKHTLSYVPRLENTRADELCTRAIYWGMRKNPWMPASRKEKLPEGEVIDPFRGFPPNPSAEIAYPSVGSPSRKVRLKKFGAHLGFASP